MNCNALQDAGPVRPQRGRAPDQWRLSLSSLQLECNSSRGSHCTWPDRSWCFGRSTSSLGPGAGKGQAGGENVPENHHGKVTIASGPSCLGVWRNINMGSNLSETNSLKEGKLVLRGLLALIWWKSRFTFLYVWGVVEMERDIKWNSHRTVEGFLLPLYHVCPFSPT